METGNRVEIRDGKPKSTEEVEMRIRRALDKKTGRNEERPVRKRLQGAGYEEAPERKRIRMRKQVGIAYQIRQNVLPQDGATQRPGIDGKEVVGVGRNEIEEKVEARLRTRRRSDAEGHGDGDNEPRDGTRNHGDLQGKRHRRVACNGEDRAMRTRTLTCNASDIRRPMAGARAIMRTKFGHHGTCRLRWNPERGRAEVVATDYVRIGRMLFRGTTRANDLDITVPFEAVRVIANWRASRLTIQETPEGLAISTGLPEARQQHFRCEPRHDGKSIDRVLAQNDREEGPSVGIQRTAAERALRETGESAAGEKMCLLTVDADGVNAWNVERGAKAQGARSRTHLAGAPAEEQERLGNLVRRKHLRDALRSMSGSKVRLTFGNDHRFLRLRSEDGNDEFILETKKPPPGTYESAGNTAPRLQRERVSKR